MTSTFVIAFTLVGAAPLESSAKDLAATFTASVSQMKPIVQSRGGQLSLGEVALPTMSVAGAKGIVKHALELACTGAGIRLDDAADLSLNVSVEVKTAGDASFAEIEYSFKTPAGATIGVAQVPESKTTDSKLLAILLGVTIKLEPRPDPDLNAADTLLIAERAEAERTRRADPPTQADRKALVLREYSVSVVVDGHELPFREGAGKPHVSIPNGQSYGIRFANDSDYDAAIEVLIDGLSMFRFADGSDGRRYTHLVIPRRSSFTVPGWYINHSLSRKFLVKSLDDLSDLRKQYLENKEDTGSIQVLVSRAWNPGERPPLDTQASSATDVGPDVQQKYRPVKKEFGRPVAIFSIRYDRPSD